MMGTRNRSGSLQFDDVKQLFDRLEEKLSSQIAGVVTKIEGIEKSINALQANQIRIDNEIDKVKEVIIKQQLYIERLEAEKRANNVVVNGVSESAVKTDDEELKTDKAKIEYLADIVNADGLEIETVFRIGRMNSKTPRPLLVRFSNKKDRNSFLFQQKKLREDDDCRAYFGPVFVNRDSTYLVRGEEKRLRDRMKEMRPKLRDDERVYIKNDKLYHNDEVIDSMDISKQLF